MSLDNQPLYIRITIVSHGEVVINWASEASPSLGCSIEISRDICMYICIYVGMSRMSN